ncbi:MAG: hypothetical protein KA146_06845 [Leptospiraceae bacterium]|jgi:endo-1,4-beta-D-glucanase Y|nr:hypothetical protein [Leptospiraceae bacterium]
MELFKKDKSSEEYYKYKEAREKFTEENVEMKITLNQKVSDPKNIQYDKVHITIYDQVGLGEDWRVEQSLAANEIDTAANGFSKVNNSFKKTYLDGEVQSSSLLSKIVSVFKKKS